MSNLLDDLKPKETLYNVWVNGHLQFRPKTLKQAAAIQEMCSENDVFYCEHVTTFGDSDNDKQNKQ